MQLISFSACEEQLYGVDKDVIDTIGALQHATDFVVRHISTCVLSYNVDYAIIDDVRYSNEIDYIKGGFGKVIYIEGWNQHHFHIAKPSST